MEESTFRPVVPTDTPALVQLAEGTGFFRPMELETLAELMDDYHRAYHQDDHYCVACERDGRLAGYVYYAPNEMADRTWYVYWIVVEQRQQGKGLGTALLRHAEAHIRRLNGRLVIIETSGLPFYEPTRRFYLRHDYAIAATLRDYYADGDDLVIFSKRLT